MRNYTILPFICVISFILISGCSVIGNPEVHVQGQTKNDWSIGMGCYTKFYGNAYNSGNADANNVEVEIKLINSAGALRDSKRIYIGSLRQGESKNFESILDGECDDNYRIELDIIRV